MLATGTMHLQTSPCRFAHPLRAGRIRDQVPSAGILRPTYSVCPFALIRIPADEKRNQQQQKREYGRFDKNWPFFGDLRVFGFSNCLYWGGNIRAICFQVYLTGYIPACSRTYLPPIPRPPFLSSPAFFPFLRCLCLLPFPTRDKTAGRTVCEGREGE